MNEENCSSIFFNHIIFTHDSIVFDIDIVHNQFKARIKNLILTFDFKYNVFYAPYNEQLIINLSNLINIGSVEEDKELEIKFMNNVIRDNSKKMIDYFLKRFDVVKDNMIILVLKNKPTSIVSDSVEG